MEVVTALCVRGLTVARGGRPVLEDVSFSAPAGALACVLGLAGAGKTSLLAAIAGLLPPVRGAVFLDGIDVAPAGRRRRGVGLLPPGLALPDARLRAGLRRVAGRGGAAAADLSLARLGLEALAERPAGTLSHGEAALALTAARVAVSGRVLLVDEAGEALDGVARRRLLAILREAADGGRCVVMATRATDLALAADHLVLLDAGRVLQAGRPASLYAGPTCAAAAFLTGSANILSGTVREVRSGGFVWTNGGRHVQAARPDSPRPSLGSPVTLCLRPERIGLLGEGMAQDNLAQGPVLDVRPMGAVLHVTIDTHLGELRLDVPNWRNESHPVIGQTIRAGWASDAATILA